MQRRHSKHPAGRIVLCVLLTPKLRFAIPPFHYVLDLRTLSCSTRHRPQVGTNSRATEIECVWEQQTHQQQQPMASYICIIACFATALTACTHIGAQSLCIHGDPSIDPRLAFLWGDWVFLLESFPQTCCCSVGPAWTHPGRPVPHPTCLVFVLFIWSTCCFIHRCSRERMGGDLPGLRLLGHRFPRPSAHFEV